MARLDGRIKRMDAKSILLEDPFKRFKVEQKLDDCSDVFDTTKVFSEQIKSRMEVGQKFDQIQT